MTWAIFTSRRSPPAEKPEGPDFVHSMREAGYKPLPSLRVVCGAFIDRFGVALVCALNIEHDGDHNTAADGSGDSFPNRDRPTTL